MECSICLEPHKSDIRCPSCDNKGSPICRSCCESYLDTNAINPVCMICKCNWSLAVIGKLLGNNFMKKIIKQRHEFYLKRENVILDSEKVNIPNMKLKLEKKQELIDNKNEIKQLKKKYDAKIERLYSQQCELNRELKRSNKKINCLVLRCPKECDGVVNPDSQSCTKCNIDVCMDCGQKIPFKRVHKCDVEDINNIKLLRSGAKNCPKCSTIIFKADGCSQMFCTICYTAFDWETLKITKGPVHNPHYIDLLNEGVIVAPTRENDDDDSDSDSDSEEGNNIGIHYYHLRGHKLDYPELYDKLLRLLIQSANENKVVAIENINAARGVKLSNLREKFLLEQINEKVFNSRVVSIEKRYEHDMTKIQYEESMTLLSQTVLYKLLDIVKKYIGILAEKDVATINLRYISNFYTMTDKYDMEVFEKCINKCFKEMKKWAKRILKILDSYDDDIAIYGYTKKNILLRRQLNELEALI